MHAWLATDECGGLVCKSLTGNDVCWSMQRPQRGASWPTGAIKAGLPRSAWDLFADQEAIAEDHFTQERLQGVAVGFRAFDDRIDRQRITGTQLAGESKAK